MWSMMVPLLTSLIRSHRTSPTRVINACSAFVAEIHELQGGSLQQLVVLRETSSRKVQPTKSLVFIASRQHVPGTLQTGTNTHSSSSRKTHEAREHAEPRCVSGQMSPCQPVYCNRQLEIRSVPHGCYTIERDILSPALSETCAKIPPAASTTTDQRAGVTSERARPINQTRA